MFYEFHQNNSGGSFDVTETVTHYVIIEADSPKEANLKAKDIGIYFNGVEDGFDCSCCGDRWSSVWDNETGDDVPMIYGELLENYDDIFTAKGKPYCYVYYADGSKKTFNK